MSGGARLLWRVLRAEGPRAVLDRAWDRALELRRSHSFSREAAVPTGFATPVLNLAATAPAPRLGGVQVQLLRRLEAEAALRPIALLYHHGSGHRLELWKGVERHAVEPRPINGPAGAEQAMPSLPAALALDGDELVGSAAAAAGAVGARALHVEGMAGLPLRALARLHQRGLVLIVSLHDFAAFCPRPHLLERSVPARFCHYSRDAERCLACLRHDWREVDGDYQQRRRGLAGDLLRAATAVIYPSEFLRRAHLELFAGLEPARQRVIEPAAAPQPLRRAPRPRPRSGGPLRHAAFIGAVRADKGALVFEETVRRLAAAGLPLAWSVYGGGDPDTLTRLRRLPGVRVHGYFRQGSLAARLARDGVELALLLSIVPESYGLTLAECAAAGVPAVAFAHGALGERVAAAGGYLLPAAGDAGTGVAELASLLTRLASGEQPFPRVPPRLLGSPAEEAAAAFVRLYAELGLA